MAKMWIKVDEANRVNATAIGGKLDGGTEVETPEGYDMDRQQDWKLVDGVLIYDPEA